MQFSLLCREFHKVRFAVLDMCVSTKVPCGQTVPRVNASILYLGRYLKYSRYDAIETSMVSYENNMEDQQVMLDTPCRPTMIKVGNLYLNKNYLEQM